MSEQSKTPVTSIVFTAVAIVVILVAFILFAWEKITVGSAFLLFLVGILAIVPILISRGKNKQAT